MNRRIRAFVSSAHPPDSACVAAGHSSARTSGISARARRLDRRHRRVPARRPDSDVGHRPAADGTAGQVNTAQAESAQHGIQPGRLVRGVPDGRGLLAAPGPAEQVDDVHPAAPRRRRDVRREHRGGAAAIRAAVEASEARAGPDLEARVLLSTVGGLGYDLLPGHCTAEQAAAVVGHQLARPADDG